MESKVYTQVSKVLQLSKPVRYFGKLEANGSVIIECSRWLTSGPGGAPVVKII